LGEEFPGLPDVLVGEMERVGVRDIGHDLDSIVSDVGQNYDGFRKSAVKKRI
jgi:hypothetical protein